MIFNAHSNLVGRPHAVLSPSDYRWVNYDEDKLTRVFHTRMSAQRGVEFHAVAYELIRLGIRLPDTQQTINQYVNDAIGFRMTPEKILAYSDNCYGTADCIGFRNNKLRIHDLKTGRTPAPMTQLEIYAGLFCLEYNFKPIEIEMELRIYQNDKVFAHVPEPDAIFHIMDVIKTHDKRLNYLRMEATS